MLDKVTRGEGELQEVKLQEEGSLVVISEKSVLPLTRRAHALRGRARARDVVERVTQSRPNCAKPHVRARLEPIAPRLIVN